MAALLSGAADGLRAHGYFAVSVVLPVGEDELTELSRFLDGRLVDGVLLARTRTQDPRVALLQQRGIPFVIAEQNRELVEKLRKSGMPAVSGNAADPSVLIQAHITNAALLVIATPDSMDVRKMAEIATTLQPGIEIVVRTYSEMESKLLLKDGIGTVFFSEEELAKGMTRHVLERFSPRS